MNKYIKRVIASSVLCVVFIAVGVWNISNNWIAALFAFGVLAIHTVALAAIGYSEIRNEFAPRQKSWVNRFETNSLR
jgi:ABC-type polysaccharide/polyol phosphate export permease